MHVRTRMLATAVGLAGCSPATPDQPAATSTGVDGSSTGAPVDPTSTGGAIETSAAPASSSGLAPETTSSAEVTTAASDGSSSGGGLAGDQFRVIDVTYTATADNTDDSHYRVPVATDTPPDWTAPIDFAAGTAYVRLEVTDKPSDVGTVYNVCFEGAGAACMGYPPVYTDVGTIEFSYDFDTFWNYDAVDWSQGIDQMALILKDENGDKQQGNPDFYPYTAHVTITIVPPGETYVPP